MNQYIYLKAMRYEVLSKKLWRCSRKTEMPVLQDWCELKSDTDRYMKVKFQDHTAVLFTLRSTFL